MLYFSNLNTQSVNKLYDKKIQKTQNIKKIIERDKLKNEMCHKNGIQIFYYSNIKNETYFDRVYYDKEELLNDIQYGKKRLL